MESVLSSEDHEEWDAQVVKEGYMFVKRPPGHKWNKIWFKAWHRRYFVITDCSRECSSQLVMYSSHQASKLRLPPILRLALHQTVHLGIMSHSQRFPKVLVIVVSDMSPLLLASEDESGVLLWKQALDLTSQRTQIGGSITRSNWSSCRHEMSTSLSTSSPSQQYGSLDSDSSTTGSCTSACNRLSQSLVTPAGTSTANPRHKDAVATEPEVFTVSAIPSESSNQIGLRGRLQMCIFDVHIGFRRIGEDECFMVWPVTVIRLYRLDSSADTLLSKGKRGGASVVTIEVGRRCPSGEGRYEFQVDQGLEIIHAIKKAVANLSAMKSTGSADQASLSHHSRHRSLTCRRRTHEMARFKCVSPSVSDRVNYTSLLLSQKTAENLPVANPDEGYINDELLR